jgi:hypothetical protein
MSANGRSHGSTRFHMSQSSASKQSKSPPVAQPHFPTRWPDANGEPHTACPTGVVYRNPKPHIKAIHAWHPTLISLGGERLVATFDLGQAVESLDYRTYNSFSTDGGLTWSPPTQIIADSNSRPSTHTIRPSRLLDGTLVAVGGRYFRDDPEEGLCNRANLGHVEMDLFLLRSNDGGNSWSKPERLIPPLVGPAFEVAHGVIELRDGRWLWPTSTWKGWDGSAPNGMKAVCFVSHDRGKTWPEYIDIFDGYREGLIHFEQSVVVLPDGRLLACGWVVDERTSRTRDVVYAVSDDGRRFSRPRSTELPGETSKLVALPDGRVACCFRSLEEPGLGVALATLDGDQWRTETRMTVWQGAPTALFGDRSTADGLSELKLGYPSPVVLPDGQVLCAFWCRVNDVNEIRWVRLDCNRIGDAAMAANDSSAPRRARAEAVE